MMIHSMLVAGVLAAGFLSSLALTNPAASEFTDYRSVTADTSFIAVGATRYAYRDMGPRGGVPLVMLNRLRGTLDDWDPALLDLLASDRRVITFDNVGISRTIGRTPTSLVGFAQGAEQFIRALGFDHVDLLGFSHGGVVAQQLALDRPTLVRRMIIAGSGPGFVEATPTSEKVWQVAGKPVNSDEDFLFLFFKDTPTSQSAGRSYLARTKLRSDAHEKPVAADAWQAQIAAAMDVGTPETSLLNRLGALNKPVLVANGDNDIMVPTHRSYAMFRALPHGKLVLYPDSGHGFLFQHAEAFGREVLSFLRE